MLAVAAGAESGPPAGAAFSAAAAGSRSASALAAGESEAAEAASQPAVPPGGIASNSADVSAVAPKGDSAGGATAEAAPSGASTLEPAADSKAGMPGAAAPAALPSGGSSAMPANSSAAGAKAAPANTNAAGETAPVGPNDPGYPQQRYLEQIGAAAAWRTVREQTNLTIAVVDTGADLEHPDLKPNLVPGVNVIAPGRPPEDDNGHGTSVAGIIAAAGNNGFGVSGMLWKAKLMPVKALDKSGYGDESSLGEGIVQAVNKGARIIVLSVGLYRYSPYMRDIAQYAESSGALLIAASGNDGGLYGAKAAVEYPAAYPTVLAVGGATPSGKPDPRTNKGPEIDLSASWDVYTTALGGGYHHEEGTSMAAPQAAAAAALVWAQYPDLKPYEVRALLKQTAKDIGEPGVDDASGFGLLQADRALTEPYRADPHEPSESRQTAAAMPLGKTLSGTLGGMQDRDWYAVNAPYDGIVTIRLQKLSSAAAATPAVTVTMDDGSGKAVTHSLKQSSQNLEWNVKKGINRFGLQLAGDSGKDDLPYLLTPLFRMEADAYETNDQQPEAFPLLPQSGTITGTFHKTGDRDWYAVRFSGSAAVKLTLSSDTMRIDPALAIRKEGADMTEYDKNGEGETEQTPLMHVTAGTYYIRVHDASSLSASPVAGMYTLGLQLAPEDPGEPNDKASEATVMQAGADYAGSFERADDADWFQIQLNGTNLAHLALTGVPKERQVRLELYDKQQQRLLAVQTSAAGNGLSFDKLLPEGLYYVKLTSVHPFTSSLYHLSVTAETTVAGYRDIAGHWAQDAIASMTAKGWMGGTGNYRFEPGRSITRAEAAAMLMKAVTNASVGFSRFKDVDNGYWAYEAIGRAAGAGWIKGYPDGSFAPDQPLSRAEMVVMMNGALRPDNSGEAKTVYRDLPSSHWAAPALTALQRRGWVKGDADGMFAPERNATRAEFAALLYRALT
ncbi:hypothetical protein VN24_08185 [Paenibacillus beijingensis]|uniref:SLH domain-containing protein n=1 Tax=Paenibacillus beijingensis TaxID=1126833 RepID=A0A0D5NRS2_9BACL|nr:hypothetical protein VN24_08185 [Paenibacillus beijingensis]